MVALFFLSFRSRKAEYIRISRAGI